MRKSSTVRAAILFAAVIANSAFAATQYWDPNGSASGLGGAGTWNTSTPNWNDSTGTGTAVTWTQGNDAFFNGTAGAVTLGTNITANSIAFDNTAGTYTINGGSNTLTVGSIVAPTTNSINATINAVITGTDLTLVSNNTLARTNGIALAATNTFTGNVNLNGMGTPTSSSYALKLNLTSITALPTTAALNYNRNYSQVDFNLAADFGTVPNNFNLNASNATGSFNGAIGILLGASATLSGVISGNSDLTFGLGLSGGAGVLTLSNHNTYTGATRFLNAKTGVTRLGIDNALPTTTDLSFGNNGTSAGSLDLNGHNQTIASLAAPITGTATVNGVTNTQGSTLSTLTISGTSTTTYSGPLGVATDTTNLSGSSNHIALVLAPANTGSLSLTSPTGTTYDGGTTVNGGTLLISNSSGSGAGAGPVTVGANGKFGSVAAGTLTGHLDNSGTLLPGGSGAVGTLSLSTGLTTNASSSLNFDFKNDGTNDLLVLGGATDAQILSTPASSHSVNINLFDLGGALHNKTLYTLFSYPATTTLSSLDLSKFNIVAPPTGVAQAATFQLQNNTSAHTIQLLTSSAGAYLTWRGDPSTGNGAWSTSYPPFLWDASGTQSKFTPYSDVTFDDTANPSGGSDPITVSIDPAGVTPSRITVNNSARDYTFQDGPINGNASLTKSGTATLVLSGSNNYSGGTTVTGGTLEIAGDSSLGAVPSSPTTNLIFSKTTSAGTIIRFDADTTLNANRNILLSQTGGGGPNFDTNGHNVTIAGNMTGAASGVNLTKIGDGTLTLTGDNSSNVGGGYINAVFVNGGTLNVSTDANLGQLGKNITLNGGTLQFGASFNPANRNINISGGAGSIDTNGYNATLNGVVGSTGQFTKTGAGTLTLTGANTLTGPTIVNGGTLALGAQAWAPVLTNAGGATINGGKLVLDYTGASSPASTIVPLLHTSQADANFTDPANQIRTALTLDSNHGLVYTDDGSSKLTVAYTWYGDANLDGTVNADDYALVDRQAAKGASVPYMYGDFNDDGVINSADYLLMDTSYAAITGPLSPSFLAMRETEFGSAYVNQLIAAVPEPTSLALTLLAAPLLTRRRRTA